MTAFVTASSAFERLKFYWEAGAGVVSSFAASSSTLEPSTAGSASEPRESITTAAAANDSSASSGLEFWRAALRLVSEQPLFGVGIGSFHAYYTRAVHALNLFLNLAVEVGLVGAGAFTWLLAVAFSCEPGRLSASPTGR